MYKRKTANAAELAEACRRASLKRKHFNGGRPRMPENELGSKSLRVRGDDMRVITAFARANSITIAHAIHALCVCLVQGVQMSKHPDFVPKGREAFYRDL